MTTEVDVFIAGGGLAGLSLARQLRQADPDIRLAVAEKRGHLPKLGLRYHFPSGGNRDITLRFELGPTRFPQVPSFQLDRGRLENFLLDENRASGIAVLDQAVVKDVTIGSPHHISVTSASG